MAHAHNVVDSVYSSLHFRHALHQQHPAETVDGAGATDVSYNPVAAGDDGYYQFKAFDTFVDVAEGFLKERGVEVIW